MRSLSTKSKLTGRVGDMTLLLFASLACVIVLTVAITKSAGFGLSGLRMHNLLIFAIVAGAALLSAFVVVGTRKRARRDADHAEKQIAKLRKDLTTAEAIIKTEPQVLIFWEQGHDLRIVTHTLNSIAGLPGSGAGLMRFGEWLMPQSAIQLKERLDKLFDRGRPFNLLLKTSAGVYFEADGRASGRHAILRMRDVAEHKRDLVKILEQHRLLSRDIRTSRALLNALPMPAWLTDNSGRVEWVNRAYVTAVEAQDEREVIERQIELLEIHHWRDLEQDLSLNAPVSKHMHLIVGGERRAYDIVVVPLDDARAVTAVDVEAIENAKGELDRQVAAYDRTLHRIATATAIFGPDQRLTFFNDAYLKLWQLDASWLQSRPTDGEILDRLRERSRLPEASNYRKWKQDTLKCYESLSVLDQHWHLPDGRTLHVMGEQRPDGGVTYLYENVTERFALESRYNALIDVQRETLDHLQEGIALFATDGRLRLFNSSFAQIWKLSHSALNEEPHIDEVIEQCAALYDDVKTWGTISQAVTGLSDYRSTVDGEMVRPDGSVIDFAALPMPDGATLVTFADVSAVKREERALKERNEALIAADRLKGQFVSHVSYELRTPLTDIMGFSEMLASPRMGALNDKQREYLNYISLSSQKLKSLIDGILDLTTIDAGALELQLAPVRIRPIIDAAVLGVSDRASRARLAIDISVEDDLVEFIADENRVRQILYNLLTNAIGFSQPGERIKIECWRENGMVAFAVEDQGVGIPQDQQKRVFERFESQSRGSRHRGVGLGLPLAKSLVELHGGNLNLHSEPGKGTRIVFRLPENGLRDIAEIDSAAAAAQTRVRAFR